MSRYKDYPIYGVAVSSIGQTTLLKRVGFSRDLNQTIEIERIECTTRMYRTKKQQAEEYGLVLCKAWIDGHSRTFIA
jgi:hypothetical protein